MRKQSNKKKIIISILVILLLALAVGYAAFSDILTISGTANAKGTFDLEFRNAEIVKNIGADIEKTTAIIGADKNTLTVNVSDLSYPGAGVEFSVDIVNVGSMPAEIQSVTPNNITGSDKIKVTGLDEIKVGHPKIEVGDKCNIHFTVEWPVDSGEILERESTISFGLQIEYSQVAGEIFEGKVSHTDTDKNGNIINTNTSTGGEVEEPDPPLKEGNLIEIIETSDYGKSINYKATVNNTEVSNWKLLYKDESNIYLILDDFLPNSLIPVAAGLDTSGEYSVYSDTSREVLLNGLNLSSYWSEFANGLTGATATGAPSFDILIKSYNEKHNTSLSTSAVTLDSTDTLYVPHSNAYNGVNFYWLDTEHPSFSSSVWYVGYNGVISYGIYNTSFSGVRPVVSLPSDITGSIGKTVKIDGI